MNSSICIALFWISCIYWWSHKYMQSNFSWWVSGKWP